MEPKDLQLPQEASVFTLQHIPEKMYRILWVMDPARLRQIDPGVIDSIGRVNIEHEIKVAQAEADIKAAEIEMLQSVKALRFGK